MAKGDPLIAKKSATWTSKNPVWGSPVQRSLPELEAGDAPNRVAQASDRGINVMDAATIRNEGPLGDEMVGFAGVSQDFNIANGNPRNRRLQGNWKPGR